MISLLTNNLFTNNHGKTNTNIPTLNFEAISVRPLRWQLSKFNTHKVLFVSDIVHKCCGLQINYCGYLQISYSQCKFYY